MAEVLRFGEVLEAAERLSEDEQETLLEILHKRLAEPRRHEICAALAVSTSEGLREAIAGEDLPTLISPTTSRGGRYRAARGRMLDPTEYEPPGITQPLYPLWHPRDTKTMDSHICH